MVINITNMSIDQVYSMSNLDRFMVINRHNHNIEKMKSK